MTRTPLHAWGRALPTLPAFILLLFAGACGTAPREPAGGIAGTSHFRSRSELVPIVTQLLRDKDWETLARYYDLRGSGIPEASLRRGDFFYDESAAGRASGDEFRRYLHPFAPGAHLDHEMDGDEPDVMVLVMVLDAPSPDSSREPVVYRFRVKRHGWGWQILPGRP